MVDTRPIPKELIDRLIYCSETGKLYWAVTSRYKNTKMWEEAGSNRRSSDGTVYCYVGFRDKSYRASRIVWAMKTGKQPSNFIDHISGDTLDNRIENLRDVSQKENCRNKRVHRLGKPVGVSFCPRMSYRPWMSYYNKGRKMVVIGYFRHIQNAILAIFLWENDGFIPPKKLYGPEEYEGMKPWR